MSVSTSKGPMLPMPNIRLQPLRFHCQALDPIRLPQFSGSAWRGLLGHSLRRSVCVTRASNCDGCLLRGQCVYSKVFETPPASPATRRYPALPHPFVLEPPPAGVRDYPAGATLTLGITLIGRSTDLTAYLIHAMQRAGERGLGRDHSRFALLDVTQLAELGSDHWIGIYDHQRGELRSTQTQRPSLPPCPDPLIVRLETPLRLKRRGHYVNPQRLDARALLGTLATRVALLAELYSDESAEGSTPPELDKGALHNAIDQVRLDARELRWVDWTRWSSRQGTHMQLGGLLGDLRLSGPGLETLWPLIALGQWVNLGKSTSFGLGRYRVLIPNQST